LRIKPQVGDSQLHYLSDSQAGVEHKQRHSVISDAFSKLFFRAGFYQDSVEQLVALSDVECFWH
jgi:hypothetical protein